ncbi:hypothetical protein CP10139811_0696 [Chlamydia ibidis]|uniref:Uncharacterized protein n=2 Tax=Chlamydia ibidis TaxID=1405396 RepID=S7J4B1_9CHLA|nr:hypothetical protein [Chlamydia ibidis]EPP34867.1 hypothetical protein CP10139811_0696 [Chlamydia ibidis]EQM62888.1 hypothetical protein H359_0016 [Chlamydia ibidis 10-1398/6]
MSFVKKILCPISQYRNSFFFTIAYCLPISCLPFFPTSQTKYSYLIFSIISSTGWLFAIGRREKQLKAATNQLLQKKINKIIEGDEGLRQIRDSINAKKHESELLKRQNQKLLNQMICIRDAFLKSKQDTQQIETTTNLLREENHRLQLQLDALSQECKEKTGENQQLSRELAETLAYQQALNEEYQATFAEQHSMLDKRQIYIGKLESKVQDLMCEIQNLLQLESRMANNLSQPSVFSTNQDNSSQLLLELKKIAFKVENAGATTSLTASRYLHTDTGIQNYSLECRQLFENLREENLGMIFIYSKKSRRHVFANSLFKTWTGHSVEDFLNTNEGVVVSGIEQWETDLYLHGRQESLGKVVVNTRLYGHIPFHYCLTTLNKGPLHNHVLGVLYPVHSSALRGHADS